MKNILPILLIMLLETLAVDPPSPALTGVFNPAECQKACWLEIEPSVTTQAEVQTILVANNMTYHVFTGIMSDEAGGTYEFEVNDNLPFVGGLTHAAGIDFDRGIVEYIKIPVDISLSTVFQEYGIPDRLLTVYEVHQIIYSPENMVFETNITDDNQIDWLYITSDRILELNHIEFPPVSLPANCEVSGSICNALDLPATVSFTLVNADSDTDITILDNGATFDVEALSTRNLNIRADIVPPTVHHVIFDLNLTSDYTNDRSLPFSLAGDNQGNYAAWTPAPGTCTLTATPYDSNNIAGTPLTINFTIINTP